MQKPLGHKAYGSIPHLPNSRLGPGDHHVDPGQARICTEQVRDKQDCVIVQEKLDGSCVAVWRRDDQDLVVLGRAGWPAVSSPHVQHRHFDRWVQLNRNRFLDTLNVGERIVGEWMLQVHSLRYEIKDPNWELFRPFDIMTGHDRIRHIEFIAKVAGKFRPPQLIAWQNSAVPVAEALKWVDIKGFQPIGDKPEGVVYRVEHRGKVDFLAKYVRSDHAAGELMKEELWNFDPRYL